MSSTMWSVVAGGSRQDNQTGPCGRLWQGGPFRTVRLDHVVCHGVQIGPYESAAVCWISLFSLSIILSASYRNVQGWKSQVWLPVWCIVYCICVFTIKNEACYTSCSDTFDPLSFLIVLTPFVELVHFKMCKFVEKSKGPTESALIIRVI